MTSLTAHGKPRLVMDPAGNDAAVMVPAAAEMICMAPAPEWTAPVETATVQFPAPVQLPVPPSKFAFCPDRKLPGGPVMFVTVTCSPPMITSNGKSGAVVVQMMPAESTIIEASAVPIPVCRLDPSVSACPYTRSSRIPVSNGVSGTQLSDSCHWFTPPICSLYPYISCLTGPGGSHAGGLVIWM